MINFTPEAFRKLESSLDSSDTIRIRAMAKGCSGISYHMEMEEDPVGADIVLDMNSFKICLDPFSKFLIKDLTIDYIQGPNGSGFEFKDSSNNISVSGVSCECSSGTGCN
jgi:iron-sulfur cluster assembly protein